MTYSARFRSSATMVEQKARQAQLYRANLRAKELFNKRKSGQLTREQVVEALYKLPESLRDQVRTELNRLIAEYRVMQR
jgi:hypothetical protein